MKTKYYAWKMWVLTTRVIVLTLKTVKIISIKIVFKSWGPFRTYELISTANLALFEWNWLDWLSLLVCTTVTLVRTSYALMDRIWKQFQWHNFSPSFWCQNHCDLSFSCMIFCLQLVCNVISNPCKKVLEAFPFILTKISLSSNQYVSIS